MSFVRLDHPTWLRRALIWRIGVPWYKIAGFSFLVGGELRRNGNLRFGSAVNGPCLERTFDQLGVAYGIVKDRARRGSPPSTLSRY